MKEKREMDITLAMPMDLKPMKFNHIYLIGSMDKFVVCLVFNSLTKFIPQMHQGICFYK